MNSARIEDFYMHDRDAERVLKAPAGFLDGKSFRGHQRILDDGRRFVSAWDAAYEIYGDRHMLGFKQLWLWKEQKGG